MTKEELISQIDSYIKENHTGDITGAVLNKVLHNIVDFSENPSKASGRKLGLVVNRAIPIRPMPGMVYYTGAIKVRKEDLATIGGSMPMSSFTPNIVAKTFGFKGAKIVNVSSTVQPTITEASFTDPEIDTFLFQFKAGPKAFKISDTYDRSRPITWSDLTVLTYMHVVGVPVLSSNFKSYRPIYSQVQEYAFQVTRPCIYLPPIKGLLPPMNLLGTILRTPNGKRRLSNRVYYWRSSVHYRKKSGEVKSYHTKNHHRLLRTKYINSKWGIQGSYVGRPGGRTPKYGGRIVIYKRLRNRLYKYMELTLKTGSL